MAGDRTNQKPRNYHGENIQGKAALVTGGTTGIGLATAKLLAERGARVLIFGRDEADLQSALAEIGQVGEVQGISADQSKVEDIRRIFAEVDSRLGGLDILVNNAAVSGGSVAESGLEEIEYALKVNLLGYLGCVHEAIPRLKARGGGHIVCVGSMSADEREEGLDLYVATKSGIQGFCESLRQSLNPQGIKVTLIEPGAVASNMNEPDPQKMAEMKMLEAEDIAESVHYVLTQPARCAVVALQIRPINQAI